MSNPLHDFGEKPLRLRNLRKFQGGNTLLRQRNVEEAALAGGLG